MRSSGLQGGCRSQCVGGRGQHVRVHTTGVVMWVRFWLPLGTTGCPGGRPGPPGVPRGRPGVPRGAPGVPRGTPGAPQWEPRGARGRPGWWLFMYFGGRGHLRVLAVLSHIGSMSWLFVASDPDAVGHNRGWLPFSIFYYFLFNFRVCRSLDAVLLTGRRPYGFRLEIRVAES